MNAPTRTLAVLALLASSAALAQAPSKVAYQGLLLKSDGTPETGTVTMKFAVFAAATGGSDVWNETQTIALTQGYYATTLGDTTPLTAAVYDGTERFLEISVNGTAMTPRMRLVSVPYAISADTAKNVVGGAVNASSISVGGNPVIDSSGNLAGNAAYQGANGVTVTGRTIGLVPGCQGGETLKWNSTNSTWQCAAGAPAANDAGVVVYTADPDGGLTLTGSGFTAFSLLRSCAAGQLLKWNGNAWACANDLNTVTAYDVIASGGLVLSGTNFGMGACPVGQIFKSTGAGGTWGCGTDSDTTYGVLANQGLVVSSNNFGLATCGANQVLKYQGSNWLCAADNDTSPTASAPIAVTTNNIALTNCAPGQIYKMNLAGNAWACAADDNTGTGGTVTNIATTGGITGGPITTTGTLGLSASVQNWPAQPNCPAGSAISSISANGTASCAVITSDGGSLGGGTVTSVGSGTGLQGGPITGSGTLSIAGTVPNWTVGSPAQCPVGSYLQVVGLNGTPTCAVDKDSPPTSSYPIAVNANNITLTTCGANQIFKMDASGVSWGCLPDNNTTYTATAPIAIGGTVVSLTTCAPGQIYKMGATTWGCAADADSAPLGTAPVTVAGNTVSLATCAAGEIYKMSGGVWTCSADANTAYGVQASQGLQVSANNFGLIACANTQILKFNGLNWACAADLDTDTGVNAITNGGGITGSIAGRTLTLGSDATVQRRTAATPLSCPSGFLRTVAQDGTSTCVFFAGTGVADTVSRTDHNHTGTYLPVGGTLACSSTDKMTGIAAATGNVICSPDLDVDAVVGNEVTNATDASLTRSGSGSTISPYTLALNVGNANTWTAVQTLNAGATVNGASTLSINAGSSVTFNGTSNMSFPAVNAANAAIPMIQMFQSGTANTQRMVIGHSATFPGYGLAYDDSTDTFKFLSNGAPQTSIDVNGSGGLTSVGTITGGDFAYAAPKTGQFIASSMHCQRNANAIDPYSDTNVQHPPGNTFGPSISMQTTAANTADGWDCLAEIPVSPGNVVTITGASMSTFDNNANCRVQASIVYKTFGSTLSGTTLSTAFDGTDATDFAYVGGLVTKAFPAFTPTVIADDTVLYVQVTISQNATGGGNCRYQGTLFTYTVSKP